MARASDERTIDELREICKRKDREIEELARLQRSAALNERDAAKAQEETYREQLTAERDLAGKLARQVDAAVKRADICQEEAANAEQALNRVRDLIEAEERDRPTFSRELVEQIDDIVRGALGSLGAAGTAGTGDRLLFRLSGIGGRDATEAQAEVYRRQLADERQSREATEDRAAALAGQAGAAARRAEQAEEKSRRIGRIVENARIAGRTAEEVVSTISEVLERPGDAYAVDLGEVRPVSDEVAEGVGGGHLGSSIDRVKGLGDAIEAHAEQRRRAAARRR